VHFSPALILVQIIQLMLIDRRLRRDLKKLPRIPMVGLSRRNTIYVGVFVVLSSAVMDHFPLVGKVLPAFGNLALAAYLFFISQAITHQRLLNFNVLLTRTLVLIAVALTLTGIYSILVAWIENSPGLFFLNSFIASFVILMLLDPLRSLVSYFTQRLLTQSHRRLQEAVRSAQLAVTGITELGALFDAILATTHSVLSPRRAALYLLRSDGTKYRRVRSVTQDLLSGQLVDATEPDVLSEILSTHPVIQYCEQLMQRGDLPILLDQILESEIERSASRVQREQWAALVQGLKALRSNLLIPLGDSGKILGFLVLDVPSPPEFWAESWGNNWGLLSTVYPYYELAAKTLRSMEVFVRQREKERLATIGEMAAGLAHEIRNPLGAIKGAAQFLDPSLDRPESKFLTIIIEEVDRLNHVVTQFLDYSKPASSDRESVDLGGLVQKTIETLRPGVPEGVKLEYFPARKPVRVRASSLQLQQVLVNLVQNSVRAVEGGTQGKVSLSVLEESDSSVEEVVLQVEDNGRGIKREHLDKLFIPFFTTSPSGTGLGLSICQKIVEAHKGRIEVATKEGLFTRFSVILPKEMSP
jgi:two-component system sensor histidine kinase HydH